MIFTQDQAGRVQDPTSWQTENRATYQSCGSTPQSPDEGSDPANDYLNVALLGWRTGSNQQLSLLFSIDPGSSLSNGEYVINRIQLDPNDSGLLVISGAAGGDSSITGTSNWSINMGEDPADPNDASFMIVVAQNNSPKGTYKFTKKLQDPTPPHHHHK